MDFRITGLSPELFSPLFSIGDSELLHHKAARRTVDSSPGFPCRISLDDAEVGETVLLLNYQHQSADTPFQASHGIYVRENVKPFDAVNLVPPALRRRILSIRGFDKDGWLIAADLADGKELQTAISILFENPQIAYLHAHYAKMGCFAARVDRLGERDRHDS